VSFKEEALKKLGASSPLDLYLKYGETILKLFHLTVSVQGLDLNELETDLRLIKLTDKTVLLTGNVLEWRQTFLLNGNSEFLDQVFELLKKENRFFKLKKENNKWMLR